MANKYYKNNRKRYRATELSLALSVILFLAAVGVGELMQQMAESNANTENFDIVVAGISPDSVQVKDIRDRNGVEQAVITRGGGNYRGVIRADMYTDEMLDAWNLIYWNNNIDYSDSSVKEAEAEPYTSRRIEFHYLEDEVLRAYLIENGIDPEPYFDAENPSMLMFNLYTATPFLQDENGNWEQYTFRNLQILKDEVETVPLYPQEIPRDLYLKKEENPELERYMTLMVAPDYEVTPEGDVVLVLTDKGTCTGENNVLRTEIIGERRFLVTQEETEEGICFSYYPYEQGNGVWEVSDVFDKSVVNAPVPAAQMSVPIPGFRIGAHIGELPFGLSFQELTGNSSRIHLIGAMSVRPAWETRGGTTLALSVSKDGYQAVKSYLKASGLTYTDYLEEEQNLRGMVKTIRLFAYGFIILVALISAANVFNTISTNVALRRSDFGMLKSIGMKSREVRGMMIWECFLYGGRALLFGVPIGLGIHYALHVLSEQAVLERYRLPVEALCIGGGSVFLVVFASMLYAFGKLRGDTPIEAIRQISA